MLNKLALKSLEVLILKDKKLKVKKITTTEQRNNGTTL